MPNTKNWKGQILEISKQINLEKLYLQSWRISWREQSKISKFLNKIKVNYRSNTKILKKNI